MIEIGINPMQRRHADCGNEFSNTCRQRKPYYVGHPYVQVKNPAVIGGVLDLPYVPFPLLTQEVIPLCRTFT